MVEKMLKRAPTIWPFCFVLAHRHAIIHSCQAQMRSFEYERKHNMFQNKLDFKQTFERRLEEKYGRRYQ